VKFPPDLDVALLLVGALVVVAAVGLFVVSLI